VKTIIFDFDGTIADSYSVVVGIIGRLTGHNSFEERELNDFKEKTIIEIAKGLEISKFKWPFLVALGRKEMSRKIDKLELFDGIKDMLVSLSKQPVNVMILSSNSEDNINKFINKHNLKTYFNDVQGNVGLLSKSRALKSLVADKKIKLNDAIYIGDEARDAIAASKVGLNFIGVGWGFNSLKMLSKYPNYKLVDKPADLNTVLKEWIKS